MDMGASAATSAYGAAARINVTTAWIHVTAARIDDIAAGAAFVAIIFFAFFDFTVFCHLNHLLHLRKQIVCLVNRQAV
jgi:hypothetical protein